MKHPILSKNTLMALLLMMAAGSHAQSYHALNGSPYAGVNAMFVNPAATVNAAYKWDVNLLSIQEVLSNTGFVVNNMSLTDYSQASAAITSGFKTRSLQGNFDGTLLNARFNINSKSAIAFGIRGKCLVNAKAEPFVFTDSIADVPDFLKANNGTNYLQGYGTHSGWLELNLNYSRVIQQSDNDRFTIGLTAGYTKALSGLHANAYQLNYMDIIDPNGNPDYAATGGSIKAAYSSNYALLDENKSIGDNLKTFYKNTHSSINLNVGFEYLFRRGSAYEEEALNAENYEWKIGVSIMDIGKNIFTPADGSFKASNPTSLATSSALTSSNNNVSSIRGLRNTLSTYVNTIDSLTSNFVIANPTRMVMSVDKNLGNHFYVNTQLNINFFSTQPWDAIKTREINLLTVTPRWETRQLGIYFPVQYNTQGQLWVGGALKLGPLLLGLHNLDMFNWLKTGTQTYNGGGYLLINIHPFKPKTKDAVICPKSTR
jgi:hypothetical protein